MPGNRAVAYGRDIEYSLIEINGVNENSLAKINDKIVVATEQLEQTIKELSVSNYNISKKLKGSDFQGSILAHPLKGFGYDHDVLLLEADFVTIDQGTGFVHIAPGHGGQMILN